MVAPSNPLAQSVRSTSTGRSVFNGWRLAVPISLICFPLLWLRIQLLATPLPLFDFMSYWVAGRFYLAGANPYAPAAMWPIEKALGWTGPPLVMLNPPWSLVFVAPLGLVSFRVAHYICLIISLGLETASFLLLWRYFGGEKSKQWIAVAIFATLLPAGVAEHAGQVTPLMLAGLTAFLFSLRHRRHLLAGVCLLPLGLKPHLLWLALLAIVLWAVKNRKWQLILGALVTYVTATLAAIAYNHNALGYLHGSTANAAMVTVCGVGGALRSIFGFQHGWLQFLPMAVGLPWFVGYWMKKRSEWSWEEDLPMVLLVSIGTAPYFWAHDFILAVPALISLAVAFSRTRTNWIGVSALYLLAQIAISVASVVTGSKAWMATVSLIWILLYKMGTASLKRERATLVVPDTADLPLQAQST